MQRKIDLFPKEKMYAAIFKTDLLRSMAQTSASVQHLPNAVNGWVTIDLNQHAYALGAELQFQEPFYCQDGVWRVISDYLPDTGFATSSPVIDFRNLRFSVEALKSAIESLKNSEKINELEIKLADCLQRGDALAICQQVCAWGGATGHRVWGNLQRHCEISGDAACNLLRDALNRWFAYAASHGDAKAVISEGIAMKGLGVSYASKHLRLLFPDKYPVLDSLVSEKFGFALNPNGYELFILMLMQFKKEHIDFADRTIGDVETGFFRFIKNGVPSL